MTFTFLEALMIGLLYFIAWWDINGVGIHMLTFQDPVMIGLIIGAAYGDTATGLYIGATIGIIYLSNAPIGANLPADSALAACITIPIAIKFNIPAETAMLFAVPFAVLGAMLDNLRRLLAGIWNRQMQKHIETLNFKAMEFDGLWGPLLVSAVLRIVPLTLLLFLFGAKAGELVQALPAWISNGFAVIGGMLPGLGIALCVNFIGRDELLPYFVIGFYASKVIGLPSLGVCLVALCFAVLHVKFTESQFDDEEDDDDEEEVVENKPALLTNGDVTKFMWRYCFFQRVSQSIEYFYGTGICYSMYPYLRKIYKDDEEGLKAALKRHVQPFITNPSWGTCLLTGSLAIEEDIAANGDPDGVKAESVVAMKSGLMGPFAGIGDSIDGMTIWPILKTILYPFALSGHAIGAFVGFFITAWWAVETIISGKLGYKLGRTGIMKALNGGGVQKLLVGAGVLGLMMMGALTATNVSLATTVTYTSNLGYETTLQSMFDTILPGMLPLIYMTLVYFGFKKGMKFINIILIVMAFGLLGSLIGIV